MSAEVKCKPTTAWQRRLADGSLVRAWFISASIVGAVVGAVATRADLLMIQGLYGVLLGIAAVALSVGVGYFTAGLIGWFVFGPLAYDQALKNGAPFEIGDQVQIIAGPHRDCISHVYSFWQQDTLRVDLGAEARETYDDIFGPHQVLRVNDADKPTDEES